ncbi:hypothetical protein E8F20_26480 [Pseudomonas sp. BN415]|uniref:hypothetical protein n=1 Tax=Pseudomonas sp. BN415 TaxID=2567889 RepID=UPI002453F0E4|nr:hypothetical protein [Pseudomonas sp. BN415]MDH4585401.1 hypothetical protein [Pseudomonas sp. BN415]
MSSERRGGLSGNDQKSQGEFPRWLIDPDYIDLELERDPDDPRFDPTLDDAETFRHSHRG